MHPQRHVPFGLSPSKVDMLTFADWVGAGPGKTSLAAVQFQAAKSQNWHGRDVLRQLVGGPAAEHVG